MSELVDSILSKYNVSVTRTAIDMFRARHLTEGIDYFRKSKKTIIYTEKGMEKIIDYYKWKKPIEME